MIRGLWNRETVALMLLAAYVPMALFWFWFGDSNAIARLWLSVIVVGLWHMVFMLVRAQPPSFSALITAIAIAMLAPEELGAFRLVLGISFGVVMGELVFGGWGRNVANPATVALSFLGFGFPAFDWPVFEAPVAWAAIPAALIGVTTGVMSVSVLAGAGLVAVVAVTAGVLPDAVLLVSGMVLVLLVADPATSAVTPAGRWFYGATYGLLVVLFASNWAGATPVQISVAAALLASLAAPLLDEIALMFWISQRRRRHGRT